MRTIFQKRLDNKKRRDNLRAHGLCIVCGQNEVGTNRDGTTSVRCEQCQIKLSNRPRSKFSAANIAPKTRPAITDDIDVPDYRDSQAFRSYRNRVDAVLDCAKKPLCFSEIRGQIPGEWPRHWVADALDLIAGIREVGAQPVRYIKDVRRVTPPKPFRSYNQGVGLPADRSQPMHDEPNRKITA